MKRYELECLKDHCGGQLAESADGNYVEFSDHEDAMASLQSDLDDMRKERDALLDGLNSAIEVFNRLSDVAGIARAAALRRIT